MVEQRPFKALVVGSSPTQPMLLLRRIWALHQIVGTEAFLLMVIRIER